MISGLFSGNLSWWTLLLQSTLCLMLGLMVSFVFKRQAARAHQALLLGVIVAMAVPLLSITVNHYGLGFFKAEPVPTKTMMRKPVMLNALESRPIPTIVVEETAIAPPIITETALSPNDAPLPSSAVFSPIRQEHSAAKLETPPATHNLIEKISWTHVLIGAWLLVTLFLLLRLLRTFILGIRLLRKAEPLDNLRVSESLFTACTTLGVRHNVDIRVSQTVHSPIIWCWSYRPILLVPAGTESLTKHIDWLSLFCHEVAHYKRLDHLVGLGTELAVTMIWWHPLLWWAKHRLLCLSEQACDDWVLASGQAGPDYAELLLTLIPEGRMAFVPTVGGKESTMKERIHRIINHPGSNPTVGRNWALIALVITMSVAMGTAFAQRRPARVAQREHQEIQDHREHLEHREHDLNTRRLNIRAEEIEHTLGELGDRELQGRERIEADQLREELHGIHARLEAFASRDHDPDETREHLEHREHDLNTRRLNIRAEEIEHTLGELGDRELQGRERIEADQLREELHGIHARLEAFASRDHDPDETREHLEHREHDLNTRRLKIRAEEIEHTLGELGDRELQSRERIEADQLREELHGIHARLEAFASRDHDPDETREHLEHREHDLNTRRLKIRAEEIEHTLGELGDRELQSRERIEADQLGEELHGIHARLEAFASRDHDPAVDRGHLGRPDLEQQVRELNGRVDRLTRDMQEMGELLRRLIEQKDR